MRKLSLYLFYSFVILFFSHCSSVKKEDPDKGIRDFVDLFQKKLSEPEENVLKLFETTQSKQAVLKVIAILQNKASENVDCEANYGIAEIFRLQDKVKIVIPIALKSKNWHESYNTNSLLVLWLKPKKNSFVVSQIDGEEFYQAFAQMKNQMQWEEESQQAVEDRRPFYELAKGLEQKFDTVIWFTSYNKEPFFYVVSGNWDNYFMRHDGTKPEGKSFMGLVSKTGDTIVPIEYDLIGTLGFNFENIVEVKKDNKFGYYDFLKKQQVIPAEYDVIIPYGKDNVLSIVKKGTNYGYYNSAYEYVEGFPAPEVKYWLDNFDFIPENLTIKAGNQAFAEIPNEDHAGSGILMPPSYLVNHGVFDEYISGIVTTDRGMNAWTEYIQTEGSFTQKISDALSAMVTTVKERYLDGREEFYTVDKLVFVDANRDTLSVSPLHSSAGEVQIKKIDTLIEVRYSQFNQEFFYDDFGYGDLMPEYRYYSFTDNSKITPLKSDRNFHQTQFIKLDSSYFTGEFLYFNEKEHEYKKRNFAGIETIEYLRQEILASYGLKIYDSEQNEKFYQFKDLPARSMSEIEEVLTEIDRHNLNFLNSMLPQEVAKNM